MARGDGLADSRRYVQCLESNELGSTEFTVGSVQQQWDAQFKLWPDYRHHRNFSPNPNRVEIYVLNSRREFEGNGSQGFVTFSGVKKTDRNMRRRWQHRRRSIRILRASQNSQNDRVLCHNGINLAVTAFSSSSCPEIKRFRTEELL